MAMVSEMLAAINQLAAERGLDQSKVFEALEAAVAAAYQKEYASNADIEVELDSENGTFRIILKKVVVDKVVDEDLQISLKEAQKFQKGLEVGDTIEIEQQVEDFGRIASQTAKQVIMQKIREAEKEAILKEFSDKVGEVFTAMMHRMQGGSAIFEIGKAMAVMPTTEQVHNEFYRIGDRYKVYLKGIEDTPRGKTLIVSRSCPEFLQALFSMEVPEIESGVVEVKACAREAGSRSKMAVVSHQDGVDPIGACVGQRGSRIANVLSELGEEKIDIIEWKEDPESFVEKALSPAQVLSVDIDGDIAVVNVEEDQLSLAIGREGQNARLAARLTGLRIDIQGPKGTDTRSKKDRLDDDKKAEASSGDLQKDSENADSQLTTALANKLGKAGVSVEDASKMSLEKLMELDGIGKVTAEKIYTALNENKKD